MLKQVFHENKSVKLATERRFCLCLRNRISVYGYFHCQKNSKVEYQISNVWLILSVMFEVTQSKHVIDIVCRLIEEEFHLRKHNLNILG